ncbi:MAG: transketolase family protein [Anaerolineaceae bacterium]|nr:transketolase family protein [Anaerolineaceae bacterium]
MNDNKQTQSPLVGLPSRKAYGKVLVELGHQNEKIVALSADLAGSVNLSDFAETFPDRFINVGVAEQDLMGVSAGLTLAGKIPYASTYAVFSALRAAEQVRTDIGYNGLPVRIVSTHGGITFGVAGATHQALEDIAVFRTIPGMAVFSPADAVETAAIIRATVDLDGPVYIRLSRVAEKTVYTQEFDYQIGKPDLLIPGEDVLLIATGMEVGEAMDAVKLLEEKGVKAGLLNVSTIKPLDAKGLAKLLKNYKTVMTVEQHNVINGLGSAVAEVIAEANLNLKFHRHGIMDIFTTSGPYKDLLSYYKLDPEGIRDTLLQVLDS